MATSGNTDYSLTARDIVIDALRENAIIGVGEVPDADELEDCIRRLNSMIKTWGTKGVLWKQQTISISGVADTPSIALPSYVREVNGARYNDSPVNQRPMARWERDEYMVMPNKGARGTPSVYYVDKTANGVVLYVWQVPSVDFTLDLDIDRIMDTITNAGQTVDIPQEWMETVTINLALRCCGIFGVQPSAYVASKAQQLEQEMFDSWRPASYWLGPF